MQSAEYFDAAAARYDEQFSESSIWGIAHAVARRILQDDLDSPPARVLDAGCGTGKWGVPFACAGSAVTFADIAPRMVSEALSRARQLAPKAEVKGLCVPVEAMKGLADSTFDLTLCMGDPLSYCSDYRAGIRELVRVTSAGGAIFISVDSRLGYLRVFKERDGYDLTVLMDYLQKGNLISWEGLPIHTFQPDELRQLFNGYGAECRGIWSLPTVSAYFLFDPVFQERLSDAGFRDRLLQVELEALQIGSSPGTHHLYGLFRKNQG
jgi:ubiquinone/menaquinone biosynthesis C-methylase UbiE